MNKAKKRFTTIDEYISAFPEDVQAVLEEIRATVRREVPEAGEKISYEMPAFTLDGRSLMYFAGYRDHVSLYPVPAGPPSFQKKLRPYVRGKGTVRFPLDRPIPYGLIREIARRHVKARRQLRAPKRRKL